LRIQGFVLELEKKENLMMSALSLEFSLDGKAWYDYLYKNEVKVIYIFYVFCLQYKISLTLQENLFCGTV